MKFIQAIIEPARLDDVVDALARREVYRLTVAEVEGAGHQQASENLGGLDLKLHFMPKLRLEVACNDEFLQPAIEAILEGSGERSIGVGKILVFELEDVVRIRTGERGRDAI